MTRTTKAPGPLHPGPVPEGKDEKQRALEERVERLEKRLDETLTENGAPHVRSDHGPDERRDELHKAVDRALEKRGK
ncbi:hypothetical protein QBK99_04755 [Corticibacterium sp. UT-5YL-CI-8]|nr:hypothetical protein [Tianweitania sp. UT-5YL-CI-8]